MRDSIDVVRLVSAIKKNVVLLEDISSSGDLEKFTQTAGPFLKQIQKGAIKLERICVDRN